MSRDNTSISCVGCGGFGGTSLLTTLTIVFVVLKLTGVIAWPWFWVLFPLILEAGGALLGLLIAGIVLLVLYVKGLL